MKLSEDLPPEAAEGDSLVPLEGLPTKEATWGGGRKQRFFNVAL